jgi:hypothetical protein
LWPRILAIVAFFAAFEGLLFHTGLYSSIVEPDSTTGYMEIQLRNEIAQRNTAAQAQSQSGAGGGTFPHVAFAARGE